MKILPKEIPAELSFRELCELLGIPDLCERIFHSNSRGELFHLQDYYGFLHYILAQPDPPAARLHLVCMIRMSVRFAEENWERPNSVFQHMPKMVADYERALKASYIGPWRRRLLTIRKLARRLWPMKSTALLLAALVGFAGFSTLDVLAEPPPPTADLLMAFDSEITNIETASLTNLDRHEFLRPAFGIRDGLSAYAYEKRPARTSARLARIVNYHRHQTKRCRIDPSFLVIDQRQFLVRRSDE